MAREILQHVYTGGIDCPMRTLTQYEIGETLKNLSKANFIKKSALEELLEHTKRLKTQIPKYVVDDVCTLIGLIEDVEEELKKR